MGSWDTYALNRLPESFKLDQIHGTVRDWHRLHFDSFKGWSIETVFFVVYSEVQTSVSSLAHQASFTALCLQNRFRLTTLVSSAVLRHNHVMWLSIQIVAGANWRKHIMCLACAKWLIHETTLACASWCLNITCLAYAYHAVQLTKILCGKEDKISRP